MKNQITEVRLTLDKSGWVVDIVGETSFSTGFVQPDGTCGGLYRYPSKMEADKAETLFLDLNSSEETSAKELDGEKCGHPDFYKMLEQMADLHSRKNHDYAGTSDPLKNLRACKRLNLEPFLGVMVRLQDKWSRLEEFVKSGELMVKDESVIDTLMDNAVYSLLAIILYREQQKDDEDVAG